MKKNIFITFLLCATYLFAQNDTTSVKKLQLKVDFIITPGINLELGITKHSTIKLDLGTDIAEAEDSATNKPFTGLFPSAELGYRHYYNFKRRENNGRNTANNSANYFGINTSYILADSPIIIENSVDVDDSIFKINAVYGLQRNFYKKLVLGLEGGLGYKDSENNGGKFDVVFKFKLGFLL